MAMKKFQVERMLRSEGFQPERQVKHGQFWTDGTSRLLVGRANAISPRNETNFMCQLRRAVEQREAVLMDSKSGRPILPPTPEAMEIAKRKIVQATPDWKPVQQQASPPSTGTNSGTNSGATTTSARIVELYKQGMTDPQIFDQLRREGRKTKAGRDISLNYIWVVLYQKGFHKNARGETFARNSAAKPRPKKELPVPAPISCKAEIAAVGGRAQSKPITVRRKAPDTIVAILTDPDLGAEQKVAMITQYYQL